MPVIDRGSTTSGAAVEGDGHRRIVPGSGGERDPRHGTLNARIDFNGRSSTWPIGREQCVIELKVLQAVRLKGRVSTADLAATLDEDSRVVAGCVEELTDAGLLVAAKTIRIDPAGRDRLNDLLRAERAAADPAALAAVYSDFRPVNATFKTVLTDWQIKDGQPNPHDDTAYDAAIVERLHGVHSAVVPIIETLGGLLPRLLAYKAKLTTALGRVDAGDTAWLARPIIDSYHTVWFELHEELILAAGASRHDEAESG